MGFRYNPILSRAGSDTDWVLRRPIGCDGWSLTILKGRAGVPLSGLVICEGVFWGRA